MGRRNSSTEAAAPRNWYNKPRLKIGRGPSRPPRLGTGRRPQVQYVATQKWTRALKAAATQTWTRRPMIRTRPSRCWRSRDATTHANRCTTCNASVVRYAVVARAQSGLIYSGMLQHTGRRTCDKRRDGSGHPRTNQESSEPVRTLLVSARHRHDMRSMCIPEWDVSMRREGDIQPAFGKAGLCKNKLE